MNHYWRMCHPRLFHHTHVHTHAHIHAHACHAMHSSIKSSNDTTRQISISKLPPSPFQKIPKLVKGHDFCVKAPDICLSLSQVSIGI